MSIFARAIRNFTAAEARRAGERSADWYDAEFDATAEYRQHYTRTNYYFLWTVVADRILRSSVRRLLDIGCGPGQFASLLRDKGFKGYRGVDFSASRVAFAKHLCPTYEFAVADLTNSRVLEEGGYECVVAMEFLEHVESDLEVIQRIRSGTKVLASVPNFPYVSHVRHFRDTAEVTSRYGRFFTDLNVEVFLENEQGKKFFLMDGTKR